MIGRETVFLLQHESAEEDVKLIGIYAAEADARAAAERARTLPGFRDAPDGFTIDPYEIGCDHWTGGFAIAVQESERAA